MGILERPASFVRDLRLPTGFAVCELGDQYITHEQPHYLAEQFYRACGCGSYISIDGNGRGTICADLNQPLPSKIKVHGQKIRLHSGFDLVTDFGTGEHIFDQAQVWRTIHQLTKPGGFIVFDRPSQGYPTHCFYRADECLFRDIAAANQYSVVRLETASTVRGELVRGVFRRPKTTAAFMVPQQGRYLKSLEQGVLAC